MTPIIEGLTHIAAIVFYTAALIMGLVAFHGSRLWARRISTIGIMLIAAGWLYFYIAISNTTFTEAPTAVLWSRVFHYNTATWLFIMALVIRRSDRFGVNLALSRNPNDE
jgi:uncharacterized membrane protein